MLTGGHLAAGHSCTVSFVLDARRGGRLRISTGAVHGADQLLGKAVVTTLDVRGAAH